VPDPEVAPSDQRRSAAILQIERALRQKATRRRRARWAGAMFGLSAAAACALFVVQSAVTAPRERQAVTAVADPTGDGARVLSPSGSEPLQNGGALLPGARLVASPNGGAALRLSTGTEISVEHDGNLVFSEAGPTEHFMLSQGAMQAHVAKLRAGERFIVSTPDAEVEVHGTVFRVAVVAADAECAESARTRIEVREGVVEVRSQGHASFLHPGEHWPASCGAPPLASLAGAAAAALVSRQSAPAGSRALASSPRPPSPKALGASTESASDAALSLAKAQNDLFSSAIAARRAGNSAAALAKFQALIALYPSSALAESAAAARLRMLASNNPGAAARAAREYLARYPRGFAASDANAILTRQ
jgi:hypothetical protein